MRKRTRIKIEKKSNIENPERKNVVLNFSAAIILGYSFAHFPCFTIISFNHWWIMNSNNSIGCIFNQFVCLYRKCDCFRFDRNLKWNLIETNDSIVYQLPYRVFRRVTSIYCYNFDESNWPVTVNSKSGQNKQVFMVLVTTWQPNESTEYFMICLNRIECKHKQPKHSYMRKYISLGGRTKPPHFIVQFDPCTEHRRVKIEHSKFTRRIYALSFIFCFFNMWNKFRSTLLVLFLLTVQSSNCANSSSLIDMEPLILTESLQALVEYMTKLFCCSNPFTYRFNHIYVERSLSTGLADKLVNQINDCMAAGVLVSRCITFDSHKKQIW